MVVVVVVVVGRGVGGGVGRKLLSNAQSTISVTHQITIKSKSFHGSKKQFAVFVYRGFGEK